MIWYENVGYGDFHSQNSNNEIAIVTVWILLSKVPPKDPGPAQVRCQNSIKWTMFMAKFPAHERRTSAWKQKPRQHSRELKKSLTWYVHRSPCLTPGIMSTPGSLIHSPVGTWDCIVTCGGMPVHCVGFSSNFLHHLVDDSYTPPTVTTVNVSRH